MTITLFCSHTSPYARKCRIVLLEKKINATEKFVDVWATDDALDGISPLGKVPVLQVQTARATEVYFDSRVIVDYLDGLSPLNQLIPPRSSPQYLATKRIEALSDGILDAAVSIRLEHTQRLPEQQNANFIARQQKKIDMSLRYFDQGMKDTRYLSGEFFSLSDIALGTALAYLDFRFSHLDWRKSTSKLARYYEERIATHPSFIKTAPPPPA